MVHLSWFIYHGSVVITFTVAVNRGKTDDAHGRTVSTSWYYHGATVYHGLRHWRHCLKHRRLGSDY